MQTETNVEQPSLKELAARCLSNAEAIDTGSPLDRVRKKYGGRTKVEHYRWTVKDQPGVFLEIAKHELVVDETYQRSANDKKALTLANAWSWIACGAIIVASRDGVFYVVDGQHRVLAAKRRADIVSLPCIVFETTSSVEEARGFLEANTQRKPITGPDKFRALVVTGDPAAVFVQRLCEQVGREVKSSDAPNSVRCVVTLLRYVNISREVVERLWPLLHELCENRVMSDRLVDALLHIELRMPHGESLTDRKWRETILKIGAGALLDAAHRAASFYKIGGAKVWATGMIQALNFKRRNRLEIDGLTKAP